MQRHAILAKIIVFLTQVLSIFGKNGVLENRRRRLCRRVRRRRLQRNGGRWNLVWNTYSEKRFKRTFRVTRDTFKYILTKSLILCRKKTITEGHVTPECRLGVCLYKLGRGVYYYALAEQTGLGESIVETLWEDEVAIYFPESTEEYQQAISKQWDGWIKSGNSHLLLEQWRDVIFPFVVHQVVQSQLRNFTTLKNFFSHIDGYC